MFYNLLSTTDAYIILFEAFFVCSLVSYSVNYKVK